MDQTLIPGQEEDPSLTIDITFEQLAHWDSQYDSPDDLVYNIISSLVSRTRDFEPEVADGYEREALNIRRDNSGFNKGWMLRELSEAITHHITKLQTTATRNNATDGFLKKLCDDEEVEPVYVAELELWTTSKLNPDPQKQVLRKRCLPTVEKWVESAQKIGVKYGDKSTAINYLIASFIEAERDPRDAYDRCLGAKLSGNEMQRLKREFQGPGGKGIRSIPYDLPSREESKIVQWPENAFCYSARTDTFYTKEGRKIEI